MPLSPPQGRSLFSCEKGWGEYLRWGAGGGVDRKTQRGKICFSVEDIDFLLKTNEVTVIATTQILL